jgi:type II secretory pathway component PulJ
MTKAINCCRKRGFTFVEMAMSVGIALVVFLMIYRFMSGTRQHYMYGTVNLQNLQEARMAINYLRRDFSCATPYVAGQGQVAWETMQKARNFVFETPNWVATAGVNLIKCDSDSISIPKFAFGSPDESPRIEYITYTCEPGNILSRKLVDADGNLKKEVVFSGMERVEFKLYTHQLNPSVPVLWVKLLVHDKSTYNSDEIGKALEVTASISSPFITSLVNNRNWRFETGYKEL